MEPAGIRGQAVMLRPAKTVDKRRIYTWLAQSNVTPSMMGPPDYPDTPVPTWDEFLADYTDYYFDGSNPNKGQFFIIMLGEREIGAVSYYVHKPRSLAEFDIWMSSEEYCGRGCGPDALRTLCNHLSKAYGFEHFLIRPSERNKRAIRAYAKAGFELREVSQEEQVETYGATDYNDSVVMVKKAVPGNKAGA